MKTLILVTGYKRSGKDTFASMLKEELKDVGVYQVANKIKENSANALGLTYKEFNDNKDAWSFHVVDELGNTVGRHPLRRIAEHVGNDMMLSFGFSKHAIALAAMGEVFKDDEEYKVITDIRLISEIETFKKVKHGYRVVVVRINRDGFNDPVPSHHRTNVECDLIEEDHTIWAYDLPELREHTLNFIQWLKK